MIFPLKYTVYRLRLNQSTRFFNQSLRHFILNFMKHHNGTLMPLFGTRFDECLRPKMRKMDLGQLGIDTIFRKNMDNDRSACNAHKHIMPILMLHIAMTNTRPQRVISLGNNYHTRENIFLDRFSVPGFLTLRMHYWVWGIARMQTKAFHHRVIWGS